MVYLLILLLLAVIGFLLISRKHSPVAPSPQVLPPKQKEQFVQEAPLKTENVPASAQLPQTFEDKPLSQKPLEEFSKVTQAPVEDKKIGFEDIQNPIVSRPVAPVVETKEQKPLQEEIANVAYTRDQKIAQEEVEDTTPTLSIFRSKKIEEPVKPVSKERLNEEKGEAAFKDLEREFINKERQVGGEVSLPSLQDFQKAPGERIEAISPVLHSAVVDEEEEESKPSIENIEETREIEEIMAPVVEKEENVYVEKKVEVPQEKVQLAPESTMVAEKKSEEISKKAEHPEFKKGAHFVPHDFETFEKHNHFAPEDFELSRKQKEASIPVLSERVQQEVVPEFIDDHKTRKLLPDSFTEEQPADKAVEEEAPNKLIEEQAVEQDLSKQTSGKNTLKRNFNFRTNKSKIESILKKENSITKDTTQTDFTADPENSILSAPESSVDRMNQVGFDERENVLREDNALKAVEENEHKTKPRGFNFKNPHRKSLTGKTVENVVPQEMAPQSENVDPAPVEDKAQVDIGKAETKKLKGFNFRNPGKVKNE